MQSRFKLLGLTAAIAAATAMSGGAGYMHPVPKRKGKAVKPCLNCDNLHQHNNAYCSPECCKAHRQRPGAGEG